MTFPDLVAERGLDVSGIRGKLTANQPLSAVTWFRVGGPAQLLFQPADTEDLANFMALLPEDVPVLPIGLGSNLLVRDGGIPGVVVRLTGRGFGGVNREGESRLRVGAAVPDKRLAEEAAMAGLGGFAFYAGIPGGIGGALRMNAGAHGGETRDVMVELTGVTRQGEVVRLSNADLDYRYRHSDAPADTIFTEAVFQGEPKAEADIRAEMQAVTEHREKAQPIREKTGGSTFKNPPGTSAWKEVDAAGCRGLQIGGARMSDMHCNFMINTGDATAEDLERLGETVRARVLAHSGIALEWEIRRLGLFPQGVEIRPFLGERAEQETMADG
ncbi:UDP-N-acetylmuramate dehydrogenase [Stappia sp. F7233]|uniref:UDP-N-acetylenolpyruvoylglucosamine reductase n=1 Tax=Stappia albiluteola TaxID=2758565 RepID=A0A839AF99_9HYPH|nr:UDP-N-acetylmuramate dehydrogenase [Stappia albiluteola]MBA5777805.1 UDP-N-acetylmuramate dehydrogenase [Stappia albiluteola]